MKSHHSNITLTVETNVIRFLNAAFNGNPDGSSTAKVIQKPRTFPAFCCSQITKKYEKEIK